LRAQSLAGNKGCPKRVDAESGFSLIELMVTVIILGILLSIAALSYAGITRESALSSAAKQAEGAMKRAKAATTQENVPYTLVFYANSDPHPNTYAFWRPGNSQPEQNKSVAGESADGGYIKLENGVTVTSQTSITFTPAGTTMSVTAATVSLQMGGESRSVGISSNGKVSL
jgi:type IV fimbrial biogenesis protein FimT